MEDTDESTFWRLSLAKEPLLDGSISQQNAQLLTMERCKYTLENDFIAVDVKLVDGPVKENYLDVSVTLVGRIGTIGK